MNGDTKLASSNMRVFPKTIDLERDMEDIQEQIVADLEMLGDIQYDNEGLICHNDFSRIFFIQNKFVTRVHSIRLMVYERREILKLYDQDPASYQEKYEQKVLEIDYYEMLISN